jgi:drug/metabolite transporter (DMT)-like permease
MANLPRSSSATRSTLLGYGAVCLIWGSTWLAIGISVRDVPPLEAAAVRFLVSGVLLLATSVLRRSRWPSGKRSWNALFVLSFTIIALPYGLLFWAEQYVTSSMAAILFSASPLLVALLTPLMMRQKVPRSAVLAMVVAFSGLVVLFYAGLSTSRPALWGGAAILAAVSISSWSVVYAKGRLEQVDLLIGTGVQLLLASVALFWGAWVFEARRHASWTQSSLIALGFQVVFGSCAAFVIYYWLLKRIEPYQLATTSLVIPIIAVLEGTWFNHEQVPPLMLVAMVVVLVSVGSVLRVEAVADRQHDILMLRDNVSGE